MRPCIIVAKVALVLIVFWSATLPLTAQPAPAQASVISPAMSKALFSAAVQTASIAPAPPRSPGHWCWTRLTMR
jgi:hypothetical protein